MKQTATKTKDDFYICEPGRGDGAQWCVRTVGGTHDPDFVMAHGETAAETLRLARAMRRWPALR